MKLIQTGFTLIELMVVVAIIGIISAVAIPEFLAYQQRVERNENCKSALLEIAVEMEEYKAANQSYPTAGLLSTTTIPYDATKGKGTGLYTFEIIASTPTTYTLRCNVAAGGDPDCGSLTYDNFGRKGAPSATNGRDAESCWR